MQLQVNGVKPCAVWSCVKGGEGTSPERNQQQQLLSYSLEVSIPQARPGRGPSCVRFIQKLWNNQTEGDSETGAGAPQGGGRGAGPEGGQRLQGGGQGQADLGNSSATVATSVSPPSD